MIEKEKIYISWAEIENRTKELYKQLVMDSMPDLVVGIETGGTNISRILHNWLGLKNQHDSISIHFYEGDKLNYNNLNSFYIPSYEYKHEKILLIDDIIDSGTTINYFLNNSKLIRGINLKIATLYWNPNNKYNVVPDYYVEKKIQENEYLVFPWEVEYTETFNGNNKNKNK